MRTDDRRWTQTGSVALVLAALTVVPGCGGDDTTGPAAGATGPAAEVAQLLSTAAQDVVADNEASFESAAFFAPQIAALLGTTAAPPNAMTAAALVLQQQCFSETVVGMTYEYDFSANAYAASNQQGAPATGARFLLYALNSSGSPQQGAAQGYLDVTCTVEPTGPTSFSVSFSLSIVANTVKVLAMNMSGPVDVASGTRGLVGAGSLKSADGSRTIGFEGGDGGGGTVGGGGFTFKLDPTEGVTAAFTRLDQQDGSFFVYVSVEKQPSVTELPDWVFEAYPGGTGQSFSGTTPIMLTGANIGTGVFACIGGSFTAPQITAASGCSNGEYEIENIGTAERAAVGEAYAALHTMWATLFDVLDTGVEVALAALT